MHAQIFGFAYQLNLIPFLKPYYFFYLFLSPFVCICVTFSDIYGILVSACFNIFTSIFGLVYL